MNSCYIVQVHMLIYLICKNAQGFPLGILHVQMNSKSLQTLDITDFSTVSPVDSLDWKNYGVDSIIDTVCNHKALAPGAIILCHNGAKYTADALDALLTGLEEKGYQIVPVSELIMRENYHMDVTGKQIADEDQAAGTEEKH